MGVLQIAQWRNGAIAHSSSPRSSPVVDGLVGWKRDDLDMGPMGTYLVLMRGEMGIGGMLAIPAGTPQPSAWLPYVSVDDTDAKAARIVELGGQICLGPQDIPNMGRIAVALDSLGATFAIFRGQQQ